MSNTERENKLLEFDAARENRRFEIQMFWQRTNYFLVLNTALAVGAFTVENIWYSLLISLFGIFSATLWFRTNLGARFWQVFWESEVFKLSREFEIRAFSATDEDIIKSQTDNTFLKFGEDKSPLRKWVDKQVLKKPSVSYNMILLSLGALLAWGLVVISILLPLAIKYCACSGN